MVKHPRWTAVYDGDVCRYQATTYNRLSKADELSFTGDWMNLCGGFTVVGGDICRYQWTAGVRRSVKISEPSWSSGWARLCDELAARNWREGWKHF